jgi:hypothetical protein
MKPVASPKSNGPENAEKCPVIGRRAPVFGAGPEGPLTSIKGRLEQPFMNC